MKISVSFLKSKFSMEETIEKINNSNANYLHVDIMDGNFVDNKNFDKEGLDFLKQSIKPLDIHLMVDDPINWLYYLESLNVDCITFHKEVLSQNKGIIESIKKRNIKVGLALNPETQLDDCFKELKIIDRILILTVKPGKGGQKFLTSQIEKIERLKKIQKKYNFEIEVDGGLNDETIKLLPKIDIIVSGSFICNSDDFNFQIKKLQNKNQD